MGEPLEGSIYFHFPLRTDNARILDSSIIVRYPAQVKKNQTLNTLLSQIDWIQSLASLVNVTIPQSKAPDSQNHLDSWLGKSKKDRPWMAGTHVPASKALYFPPRKGPPGL